MLTLFLLLFTLTHATQITLKYGGYCQNFLNFNECTNPSTMSAALAFSGLRHRESTNPYHDYTNKIHTEEYQNVHSHESYNQLQGQQPFTIYPSDPQYASGCFLHYEASYPSASYWSIHWRRMLPAFELGKYNERKAYVESKIDTTDKYIEYAYSCHYEYPCICKVEEGLAEPDQDLQDTYHTLHESSSQKQYQGPFEYDKTYEKGNIVSFENNKTYLKIADNTPCSADHSQTSHFIPVADSSFDGCLNKYILYRAYGGCCAANNQDALSPMSQADCLARIKFGISFQIPFHTKATMECARYVNRQLKRYMILFGQHMYTLVL